MLHDALRRIDLVLVGDDPGTDLERAGAADRAGQDQGAGLRCGIPVVDGVLGLDDAVVHDRPRHRADAVDDASGVDRQHGCGEGAGLGQGQLAVDAERVRRHVVEILDHQVAGRCDRRQRRLQGHVIAGGGVEAVDLAGQAVAVVLVDLDGRGFV